MRVKLAPIYLKADDSVHHKINPLEAYRNLDLNSMAVQPQTGTRKTLGQALATRIDPRADLSLAKR
ncbi:hypothetical protein GCM10007394_04390 [Salinibacterium amurskyense]|nr:hypothetical protein GCM10007394_04390 [Salinibacterium amurskyense]